MGLILLSCVVVILQTEPSWGPVYKKEFRLIEWCITTLFTIEYILRVLGTPHPWRYVKSPMGILDFISVFPIYLSLVNLVSFNYLVVVRLIRLFRLVRMFDLVEYTKYAREVRLLQQALVNSQRKIKIFIVGVMISVTIIGSLMYVIEGPENGFRSIAKSIYWAIVTITTVGYGDVAPQTPTGQFLASLLMLLGFSTIVVFTSIVGAEIYRKEEKKVITESKSCLDCGIQGHDSDASYCKYCGGRLWG
ncbi:MAG: ion transporter [Microscillaceae bacterium]